MPENSSYAIVKHAGKQYRVAAGDKLVVDRLMGSKGDSITIEEVIFIKSGESVGVIGTPVVKGAKVSAKIVSHVRGPKLIVFKKRRRKGFKKKQGHRQDLTELRIEEIVVG
jgi:large subunit ribosomal protein L21